MVSGHFATALLPYEFTRNQSGKSAPFWIFLLASQFLDFLLLGFLATGVESLTPTNVLDLSFAGMRADMFVSHDLVPVVAWSVLFGFAVWGFTRQRAVALWCVALVGFHELCDLLVGFKHGLMADDHPSFGLGLYTEAPTTGLLIEALLSLVCVWLFVQLRAKHNRPVPLSTQRVLYGFLVGGALISLPIAHLSARQLLALP